MISEWLVTKRYLSAMKVAIFIIYDIIIADRLFLWLIDTPDAIEHYQTNKIENIETIFTK